MKNTNNDIRLDLILKEKRFKEDRKSLSAEDLKRLEKSKERIREFVKISSRYRKQVTPEELAHYVSKLNKHVRDVTGSTQREVDGTKAVIQCGNTTPCVYGNRDHCSKKTYHRGSIVSLTARKGIWYLTHADYDDLDGDQFVIEFTEEQKKMIVDKVSRF